VVVISQSFADKHYAGENPLGRRILFDNDGSQPPVEIVGVVGDVHHYSLAASDMPQIYVPFSQRPSRNVNFIVKAAVAPLSLAPSIRTAIRNVDADLPLVGLQPAGALLSDSVSMPRFRTLLMTGFGLTALLLAVVGIYGVMAYTVSQRTREIGVRVALGATRASVFRLVLGEAGPLVGAGIASGLFLALVLSRVLESMLFGVGSRDPLVFVAVPLILALVAAVATLVPARRAARLDPVNALGED
jgi:putative ABC transport system permease protein